MNNELADVERLLDLIGEITFGVEADLGVGRELALLARHSSSLCTRLLATDRRALPAAVDHDLATAGQAFADAEYWLSKFVMLVERAEALSCSLPEGELEELARRLFPATTALERAARAAGPYLKLLEQAPDAAPTKPATVGELEAHFVGLKPHVRASVLQLSQEEIVAYLRDQGLRTTARTLRKTHSYRVVN
jgi:hypothetical protein